MEKRLPYGTFRHTAIAEPGTHNDLAEPHSPKDRLGGCGRIRPFLLAIGLVGAATVYTWSHQNIIAVDNSLNSASDVPITSSVPASVPETATAAKYAAPTNPTTVQAKGKGKANTMAAGLPSDSRHNHAKAALEKLASRMESKAAENNADTTKAANSVKVADTVAATQTDAETEAETETDSAPHIVFIMADDLGFNDLGEDSTDLSEATIFMTTLREGGLNITRYYTQSSCTPARAAFLSGRYPGLSGMGYDSRGSFQPESPYGLSLEYELLPSYMKSLGYSTEIVGKWNVGHYMQEYLPTERGFDQALTFQTDQMHYHNYTTYPREDEGTWVDLLLGYAGQNYQTADAVDRVYSTELFSTRGMMAIQDTADAGDDADPLFLYLAYQAVHVPHEQPSQNLYNEEVDGWRLSQTSYSYRKNFAKTLIALDNAVKLVVEKLISTELMANTFLVVASDNGGCPSDGSNNYPLRGGKFDAFEGGVRVPSFVYSPLLPAKQRGTESNALFHVTDWLPTLYAMGGGDTSDLSEDIDGVNQYDHLMGSETVARNSILLSMNAWTEDNAGVLRTNDFKNSTGAMIVGDYKFIQNQVWAKRYSPETSSAEKCSCGISTGTSGSHYLYNVFDDPYETTNLYDDESYAEVAAKLENLLREHYKTAAETGSSWKMTSCSTSHAVWAESGYVTPFATSDDDVSSDDSCS